ncbi:glutamyl aminopeptidase-like [Sycon ciliatum]|uniref:glutamyl aminopeptidase-like n=1 Tax=Sycon ciliatum TaxID=27933 RepID=UPI0031F650DE
MASLKSYRKREDSPEDAGDEGDSEMHVADGAGELSSDNDFIDDDEDDLMARSSGRVAFHGKRSGAISFRRKICILVIVVILVVAVIVVAVVVGKKKENCHPYGNDSITVPMWERVRLPENIVPKSYKIALKPDLVTSHVDGNTTIEIQVTSGIADAILVHAKNMSITSSSVSVLSSTGSMQQVTVKEPFFSKEHDFYVLPLAESAKVGTYYVQFTFNYSLSSGLVGFYGSQYKDSATGEIRKLATTQFEPTDARRAFPCFDEPAMKAVFNISIVRDAAHTALSNMDIEHNETLSDGLVRVHFRPTVKMSTYLVAFIVSDFHFVQSHTNNPSCPSIKVRVWCRQQSIDQTTLALNVAVDVLGYYERFYNICYPLDKQDLVAIPDFAAGAMENWGLITYRETALLYNNMSSSTSDEQWVAVVVAHELAHQWFGDLVTMEWWSDLWLNEGFATFMEYIGAGHYAKGQWDMQLQFMVDDFERALASDSLPSSHPILATVHSPSQINEIFDSISYSKGGSVLRMLRGVIGETAFIDGIRRYLQKHTFASARTADLWAAMDEVYQLMPSISDFMDTWTLQMGYPLVTVLPTSNGLMVDQQRFLIGSNGTVPESKFHSEFGYVWYVPINYQTDVQLPGKVTFLHQTAVTIQPTRPYQWYKLNAGNNFYYRVNYPASNWEKLTQQLSRNHSVFSVADRAGLIDDAFALANDGRVPITTAMATTDYLEQEDNYVPWLTGIDALSHVDFLLSSRLGSGQFRAYFLKKVQRALSTVGYNDNGTHAHRLFRTALLHRSCDLGDQTCITAAVAAVNQWMATGGPNPIPANFRTTYYATAIAHGDEKVWNFFWGVYQNATVAVEKRKCLYALSQTKVNWLLHRYLVWALDENKIRSQDSTSVIRYVASNSAGQLMAWDFVRANWNDLLERYGEGSFSFSRLILSTTAFSTPFYLQEVKKFFAENPNAESGQRATQQTLEKIQANINWLARNEDQLSSWLTAKGFQYE